MEAGGQALLVADHLDVGLQAPRRDRAALNRSLPNLPSVFPQWPYVGAALLERYNVSNFGCNLLGSLRPLARSTTNPTWPIDSP